MPKHRPPRAIWAATRARIWTRDAGCCQHCGVAVSLARCEIDHIQSGKQADNADAGLRTLCRRCHVLRADPRHRHLIAAALRDGIIPADWRGLVWDD